MAWPGAAKQGQTWHGEARFYSRGNHLFDRGEARLSLTRPDLARQGKDFFQGKNLLFNHGVAGLGEARLGTARQGEARVNSRRNYLFNRGQARHGEAWQSEA